MSAYTICPKCGEDTLDVDTHNCDECGYSASEDMAVIEELRQTISDGLRFLGAMKHESLRLAAMRVAAERDEARSALREVISYVQPAETAPISWRRAMGMVK